MKKNQVYSTLFREYRKQVENYNAIIDGIIKIKADMDRFWKYKNDYPADWKRMAEKLSSERTMAYNLKCAIRSVKMDMKEASREYQS